jgi:single-stranded-DNA-specific exonuclease
VAARAYVTEPYSYAEARALAEGLGISEPLAVTLVRRGYRTPEEARRFLAADEVHDPFAFHAMAEVVEMLRAAAREGRRITVHGDYDVDGVCATAILVAALRELGAQCDWYIPDRLGEGYGLSSEGVRRLAARGTRLLLTADCGITCAAEVAEARGAGMEVVVTDHHSPPERLPDCPLLHPELSGYPFAGLCGTGVAYKLACALRAGSGHPALPSANGNAASPASAEEADLDLVALATVADLVPLQGENRALVRRGLTVARRARRPGMRALIEASGSDPERLDEGDLAFRLAPRVNAAGRLYRADAGVELFLTDSPERAAEIAAELDRANRERREAERRVESAAEAARRELPARLRDAPALVIAGQGWHPGVVGIVASRLVERHWRPVVLLSMDEAGNARGSGRSIPGFDLLAGLQACAPHLLRFGGHRAAAGLELRAAELDAFRERFIAHAASHLGPEDLVRTERIDALVGGDRLGLELAQELERLAPFGAGNPGVRLLVPSARLGNVTSIGDGKHSRFSLQSGGARALGVAFDRPSLPEAEAVDAAVELEVNHWNGSVEPRVVLRELYGMPAEPPPDQPHGCACEPEEWWHRFRDELSARPGAWPRGRFAELAVAGGPRQAVWGRRSAIGTTAELVSSGESVLALCADASRRAGLAAGAAGLARFGGGAALIACGRCGSEAVRDLEARWKEGLALADYAALALEPGIVLAFEHLVLVDPPPAPQLASLCARGPADRSSFLHSVWGEQERGFALRVLDHELGLRRALEELFRALGGAGALQGEPLRRALAGSGPHPRSPELAARCTRVLAELGLVAVDWNGHECRLGVVSSEQTNLDRSAAFRAYGDRLEEGKRYLASLRQP